MNLETRKERSYTHPKKNLISWFHRWFDSRYCRNKYMGIFITIYVIASHSLLSTTTGAITGQVLQIFRSDPIIFSANLIVGGFCSILGGYIGALIAKHDELLNRALSSVLCLLTGVYSIDIGSFSSPLLVSILSLLIDPALCMFGGYLRLLQITKKNQILVSA